MKESCIEKSRFVCSLPSLLMPSHKILKKKHLQTSKFDSVVEEVELVDVNSQYVRVRLTDGQETNVTLALFLEFDLPISLNISKC